MSVTCGYDAAAQGAVERQGERFPVYCHECGHRIPYHFSRDRLAELQAEVKRLTSGSAMIDLYLKVKDEEDLASSIKRVRPVFSAERIAEADAAVREQIEKQKFAERLRKWFDIITGQDQK